MSTVIDTSCWFLLLPPGWHHLEGKVTDMLAPKPCPSSGARMLSPTPSCCRWWRQVTHTQTHILTEMDIKPLRWIWVTHVCVSVSRWEYSGWGHPESYRYRGKLVHRGVPHCAGCTRALCPPSQGLWSFHSLQPENIFHTTHLVSVCNVFYFFIYCIYFLLHTVHSMYCILLICEVSEYYSTFH